VGGDFVGIDRQRHSVAVESAGPGIGAGRAHHDGSDDRRNRVEVSRSILGEQPR
jgi:hypothetical protein